MKKQFIIILLSIFFSFLFFSNVLAATYYSAKDFYYTSNKKTSIKGTVVTILTKDNDGQVLSRTEKTRTFKKSNCDKINCVYIDSSDLIYQGLDDYPKKNLYSGLAYKVNVQLAKPSESVLLIYKLENEPMELTEKNVIDSMWVNIKEAKEDTETTPTEPGDPDTDTETGSGSNSKPPEPFQETNPISWKSTFDNSMFCGEDHVCDSYQEWISTVWNWAIVIAIPLSVLVIAAAGVVWMTSAGNPDRITFAKKLIIGVLSGVGLLIVARVILINIIGLDTEVWNVDAIE